MRPDTTYTVPPGTRYLIITVKKCYFTVDKVASDVLLEGSVPFNSHRTHVDVYAVPPPTPRGPALVRPEERHHRRAAKRTRRRGPQREESGCSSWPSPTPMEVEEVRPDTAMEAPGWMHPAQTMEPPASWETPREGSTEEARHIEEMLTDLASCASFPDFNLLETNQDATFYISQPDISDGPSSLPDQSLVTPTPFAMTSTTASCVPFATTSGDSSVIYVSSVPFDTTPGGSSVAYVLPFATTGSSAAFATVTSDTTPVVTSDTTPVVTSDTTSSSCTIGAPLPAPRLWRRTQRQRTAAQAHAIVFSHRTYLWEDDDAPGMGATLRAAMNNDTAREAPLNLHRGLSPGTLDLSPLDLPLDLSRPCASAAS
ncbi:hypothetical protein JTE90_017477 [Oedothorax gibbosus]|uniref:Uncharacterized protein n=1 Tax=Oedothorax gibbosus TaxID=931172 RepID=A0AAV6UAW1_9ARAC|nr:hypothetical protein JTE90_017477 [Oedothorax gibbosus]